MSLVALLVTSCTSSFYSSLSSSAYDDLYASHDRTAMAQRQQAEAEARRAEAEARRAEAEAQQAQYEAEIARLNAAVARNNASQQSAQSVGSNDLIIIDDDNSTSRGYQSFVADSYESAYARRLKGFKSASYRMPSSYFNLRYGGSYTYATAYDPAFYNVMVSGDQVWVEPRYITSMFGTWGATNATAMLYSPWYYGWGGRYYDPWYYSWYGYPRYSWLDWNWNICYGGGWNVNLWWGWGGHYHPWRPYYHHHHHFHPHYGHHIGHGGWWHGYGSRHNAPRVVGNNKPNLKPQGPHDAQGRPQGTPSRTGSIVNRGSVHSTPYRSPITGSTYGQSSRGKSNAEAAQNSVGRGSASAGSTAVTTGSTGTSRSNTSMGRGTSTSSNRSTTSGSAIQRGTTSRGSATSGSSRSSSVQRGTSSKSSAVTKSTTSSSSSRSRVSSSSSRSTSSSYNSGSSSRSSYSSSSSRSSYSSGSSGSRSGGYSGGGYSGGGSSRGGGSGSSRGGR